MESYFTLVTDYEGDWAALYNNGQKVFEDHISAVKDHIIDALHIRRLEATPEQQAEAYRTGRLPEVLDVQG